VWLFALSLLLLPPSLPSVLPLRNPQFKTQHIAAINKKRKCSTSVFGFCSIPLTS
jgi:hypothetical protein